MPVLNWIGKDAVVKHHKEVPFRLLEPDTDISCGDDDSGNLIVQGDNLHALKALLPRYAGQVKCIYIDPPYNTGNEGWAYNDNVKSPEILKWLGEVVGKEGETLDRHDRWLCMMYPRLLLLKQFLREDGAIFVSIDDNEVATLRYVMNEIFGSTCFISNLIWQKKYSPQNDARFFSEMHDHVLVYSRSPDKWIRNLIPRTEKQDKAYKNPDDDPRGPWKASDLTRAEHRDRDFYGITTPSGKVTYPASGRSWSRPPEEIERLRSDNRLWFGTKSDSIPSLKRFLSEVKDGVVPTTIWTRDEVGDNQEATQENKEILGERLFATPKPYRLIQRILQIATDEDSLILDSFAGSGTTGHAVLKQNAEDGGNRKFILVEMDEKIAEGVTAERVRRVANGYTKANGDKVEGLGGGFQYCRLSEEPLFLADGRIRETVTFAELAEFVWFMESGTGMSEPGAIATGFPVPSSDPLLEQKSPVAIAPGSDLSALLGVYGDRAVFLLYNGILKDRSDIGGNVLNGRTLEYIDSLLPEFEGERVIYGARTRFDKKKLASLGITFHQLPYDLATKTWF